MPISETVAVLAVAVRAVLSQQTTEELMEISTARSFCLSTVSSHFRHKISRFFISMLRINFKARLHDGVWGRRVQ